MQKRAGWGYGKKIEIGNGRFGSVEWSVCRPVDIYLFVSRGVSRKSVCAALIAGLAKVAVGVGQWLGAAAGVEGNFCFKSAAAAAAENVGDVGKDGGSMGECGLDLLFVSESLYIDSREDCIVWIISKLESLRVERTGYIFVVYLRNFL